MRSVAFAALLAATVATPAFAQDEANTTFTGGHIEVIGGYDNLRSGGSGDGGITYGIAGGFDFQAGGAVIGIEGEAADSTVKDCERDVLLINDRLCAIAKRDLYAGGRVGFVAGNTLIYGKAGYTNLRVGAEFDDGTAAGAANFSDSSNLDGLRVGAGAEFTVSNFLVKAEYRYSNYEQGLERHQVVAGVGIRF